MFSRREHEDIWSAANNVDECFPVSYSALVGHQRLAVLRLLKEPVQSTLHQIMQLNVDTGTHCIRKTCSGVLDKHGACSEKCAQSGNNTIQDIMECKNCDYYGFPCSNCNQDIFHGQLREYIDY